MAYIHERFLKAQSIKPMGMGLLFQMIVTYIQYNNDKYTSLVKIFGL